MNIETIQNIQKLRELAQKFQSRSSLVPSQVNYNTSDEIIVSVCVQTYNHENYIQKCLESILEQRVNFKFEIILGDNESSDGTTEICKEYAEKFGHIIKFQLRRRSDVIYINGRPTGRANAYANMNASKGKYIAFLEGDDFWTNPEKLQKQVDVLEAKPEIVCCHHWHTHFYDDHRGFQEASPHGYYPKTVCTVKEILENKLRLKSRTLVFRRVPSLENFFRWHCPFYHGDVALSIYLGQYGSFYFINEKMAAYRQTGKGVSAPIGDTNIDLAKHLISLNEDLIFLWEQADKLYKGEYHSIISNTIPQFRQETIRLNRILNPIH